MGLIYLCTFFSLVCLRGTKVFPVHKHHPLKVNRKFQVKLTAFVTSALINVSAQLHSPATYPWESDTSIYRTGEVPLLVFMHQHEKNPANAMNHNQILHAVVSPLTD